MNTSTSSNTNNNITTSTLPSTLTPASTAIPQGLVRDDTKDIEMTLTEQERKQWQTKITQSAEIDRFQFLELLYESDAQRYQSVLFKGAPASVRDDAELARQAIEKDPLNFQFCSDRLRNSDDLARQAVAKSPEDNFAHCSARLRDDKDFVRFVLRQKPFEYLREMKYCEDYGYDLPHHLEAYFPDDFTENDQLQSTFWTSCSQRLRDDPDIIDYYDQVSIVVYGLDGLKKCHTHLRDDDDFARMAVDMNPNALIFCSDRLRDDEHFVRATLVSSGHLLIKIHDVLKKEVLSRCSERLKDNDDLVRLAIEIDPSNFQHCSDRLQSDPLMNAYADMVRAAWNKEPYNPSNLSPTLRNAYAAQQIIYQCDNSMEIRKAFVAIATQSLEQQRNPTSLVHPATSVNMSEHIDADLFQDFAH